jgi:hypothetical protein
MVPKAEPFLYILLIYRFKSVEKRRKDLQFPLAEDLSDNLSITRINKYILSLQAVIHVGLEYTDYNTTFTSSLH